MSNGKKLIRIGSRLMEVPLGDASEKKSKPAPARSSSPPVAPVAETSEPAPVIVTPQEEVAEEPVKKPRRGRRKKADG